MGKDGKLSYRKCDISYSICGDDTQYSATAWITIGLSDLDEDKQILLENPCRSIELAEETIIKKCKAWLDNEIDVKKTLIPVKKSKGKNDNGKK